MSESSNKGSCRYVTRHRMGLQHVMALSQTLYRTASLVVYLLQGLWQQRPLPLWNLVAGCAAISHEHFC